MTKPPYFGPLILDKNAVHRTRPAASAGPRGRLTKAAYFDPPAPDKMSGGARHEGRPQSIPRATASGGLWITRRPVDNSTVLSRPAVLRCRHDRTSIRQRRTSIRHDRISILESGINHLRP